MLPQIAGAIRNVERLFRDEWTTSAAVYLPVPDPATLHRNPQLAATYRRILDESGGDSRRALDCWYERIRRPTRSSASRIRTGWTAPVRVTEGCSRRTTCATGGPRYESPVSVDYHGLTVLKAGPWSQGPVFLQQLRLLEGFDLRRWGTSSAEYVHTADGVREARLRRSRGLVRRSRSSATSRSTSCCRREYARRAPDAGRRRIVALICGSRLAGRTRAAAADRRCSGAPVAPGVRRADRATPCTVDVVDRFGNMVAATPSGGWLWGAPVIPELGFCLGTRAQMFWLEEGLPNSLEPGKRPRTTLSRRSWRAAAIRTSRSALPAATSRTSGRCNTLARARALRDGPAGGDRRPRPSHRSASRAPSIRARRALRHVAVEARCRRQERSTVSARAGTTSRRRHRGRSAA